jgi:hypothetical protein
MKKHKSYLIFLIIAVVLTILVLFTVFLLNLEKPKTEKYCKENKDCACGVHIETGKCFFGNINYVNTSKQCPDFCNGIGGNIRIQCINNECKQVSLS